MARIEGEIVIERPIEEVFDFVADERTEPRYNPRLLRAEHLTAGPIGTGTRFRAEMRGRRRPVEMTLEFTDYDRPRRLASTTYLSTMEVRGGLTFGPVREGRGCGGSGSWGRMGLFRLLAPLVGWVGRRQERAIWSNLKRLLEAREESSADA